MSRPRVELQAILENILGSDEVYFQPPSNVELKYPAIIYKRGRIQTLKADDIKFVHLIPYEITVIDRSPEGEIANEVLKLPYCSHNSSYVSENLHHDNLTVYF